MLLQMGPLMTEERTTQLPTRRLEIRHHGVQRLMLNGGEPKDLTKRRMNLGETGLIQPGRQLHSDQLRLRKHFYPRTIPRLQMEPPKSMGREVRHMTTLRLAESTLLMLSSFSCQCWVSGGAVVYKTTTRRKVWPRFKVLCRRWQTSHVRAS